VLGGFPTSKQQQLQAAACWSVGGSASPKRKIESSNDYPTAAVSCGSHNNREKGKRKQQQHRSKGDPYPQEANNCLGENMSLIL